jgi:hypothetical protein
MALKNLVPTLWGNKNIPVIRTYLPMDEGPGKTSGASAFGYSIP